MSKFLAGVLMPHPPIIIPEIGKEELVKVKKTVEGMREAARRIVKLNPNTIIVITPHGPLLYEDLSISLYPRLRGNFADFGAADISLAFEVDIMLSKYIIKKADRLGINLEAITDDASKTRRIALQLDHGALVPLYFLHEAGYKGQIVHISVGAGISYEEMYTFGKAVQNAIAMVDKKTAIVASGDLSHRLTPDAPCGYNSNGKVFDNLVVKALENTDVKSLLNIDAQIVSDAGECGLRSVYFLLGSVGGLAPKSEVLSYEGPFGVGYAVVMIIPTKESVGNG